MSAPSTRLDEFQAIDIRRMLRAKGIGASDCQLVVYDGFVEVQARGGKRIAIVALTLDGQPVDAWEARDDA